MNEPQDTLAISEFKATCLKVLDQVKRTGRSVVVTRRGESIAMVVPPPPPQPGPGWLGAGVGSAKIIGDVVAPVIAEDQWEVLGS